MMSGDVTRVFIFEESHLNAARDGSWMWFITSECKETISGMVLNNFEKMKRTTDLTKNNSKKTKTNRTNFFVTQIDRAKVI